MTKVRDEVSGAESSRTATSGRFPCKWSTFIWKFFRPFHAVFPSTSPVRPSHWHVFNLPLLTNNWTSLKFRCGEVNGLDITKCTCIYLHLLSFSLYLSIVGLKDGMHVGDTLRTVRVVCGSQAFGGHKELWYSSFALFQCPLALESLEFGSVLVFLYDIWFPQSFT